MGSSPATGPTQNLGHVAAGMQQIAMAIQILSQSIPMVGATSEPGMAVLESLRKLSKVVQPGAVSEGDKTNQMKQMLLKQQQMAPHLAAVKAQGGGAAAPPGAGAAGAPPAQAAA